MNHRRNWLLAIVLIVGGCASHPQAQTQTSSVPSTSSKTPTTHPVLYCRTGGIAGTVDRVVIWPDGLVDVHGKLLTEGRTRLARGRLEHLIAMFDGWEKLKDQYLATNVADAYTITIDYGDKRVEASDLASDLPKQFRDIFTEIEAIAGQVQGSADKPAP